MSKPQLKSQNLQKIASLIRYLILTSTTTAGSGHPTTSLSATDLMTTLFFGGFFRFDLDNPVNPANDRLVFSKGHASPLFYSLYTAAGVIKPQELMKNYRKFGSELEGHPTQRFKYTEAATGSLGQGLSVGFGLALALRRKFEARNPKHETNSNVQNSNVRNVSNFDIRISDFPKIYVLLGDGEMAEGSTWEAINLASYYKLDNLVAILDVNRLGQSQETMLGWDTKTYEKRFQAFGWETVVIDGHDYGEIARAFRQAQNQKPFAIIAQTVKGKGVSFLENKEGWHGKPVPQEQLAEALKELGEVDLNVRGEVKRPVKTVMLNSFQHLQGIPKQVRDDKLRYKLGDQVATRKAFGTALARLGEAYPNIVSLDAEVKNSTYSEIFKEKFPDRFFEMFIAEQNMVGAAIGFSRLGFIPFVSTFSAFLTRAFDQMRMAAISGANIKFCGSHAGVSIGEDGPSQMGLEDLAMFRAIYGSVVLYPADAVSTEKLVEEMIRHEGICYMRTSRPATSVIYGNDEKFPIGGCKVHTLKGSTLKGKRKVIIIAAGVTLFEALKAQEELAKEGIEATVVDCYSVKPIDSRIIRKLGEEIGTVITVEDHWIEGGLGDEVLNVFGKSAKVKVYKLAVTKMPRSGKPQELMDYEGISSESIFQKAKSLLK